MIMEIIVPVRPCPPLFYFLNFTLFCTCKSTLTNNEQERLVLVLLYHKVQDKNQEHVDRLGAQSRLELETK